MNWLRNIARKISTTRSVQNTKLNAVPTKTRGPYDLIGPADKISNLRAYKYYVPVDEAKCERDYRRLREEVYEFNHQYWTEQNLKFIDAKKKYLDKKRVEQLYLKMNGAEDADDEASPNTDPEANTRQMNEFYKQFLNENYINHYEYNKKWFNYNFAMIIPAIRVYLYRKVNRNKSALKQKTA